MTNDRTKHIERLENLLRDFLRRNGEPVKMVEAYTDLDLVFTFQSKLNNITERLKHTTRERDALLEALRGELYLARTGNPLVGDSRPGDADLAAVERHIAALMNTYTGRVDNS